MKTMDVSKFKSQCLSLIDDVYDSNEEVIITRNGEPMAKLIRYEPNEIFGCMRGECEIVGDLVEPITPPEDWDEEIFPASRERKKRKPVGKVPR